MYDIYFYASIHFIWHSIIPYTIIPDMLKTYLSKQAKNCLLCKKHRPTCNFTMCVSPSQPDIKYWCFLNWWSIYNKCVQLPKYESTYPLTHLTPLSPILYYNKYYFILLVYRLGLLITMNWSFIVWKAYFISNLSMLYGVGFNWIYNIECPSPKSIVSLG